MAAVPADVVMFEGAANAQDNGSDTPDPLPSLFTQVASIDSSRWNKAYPYQLLLVKRTPDGKWSAQDSKAKRWKFTLPFTPESLQLSMPFAINVQATQNGVIEEHNGSPFRQIQFSGTTGVLPLKGNPAGSVKGTSSLPQAIFAGTLANAARAATAGAQAAGIQSPIGNTVTDTEFQDKFKGSGYYQIRLLLKFLEDYAALKKTDNGRDYQLAFAMWKDEAVYLVTPLQFSLQRTAASPFEYLYNISLKAWARVQLDTSGTAYSGYQPQPRNPNKLAKLLKTIDDARESLADFRDTLSAVTADLNQALYEPLREASLFAKDLLGVPLTVIDLPAQLLLNAKSSIITYVADQQTASNLSATFNQATQATSQAWNQIAQLASNTGAAETAGGQISTGYAGTTADPANAVFNDPIGNYALFDLIQVGQLKMPPTVIAQIATERNRVRQLTRYDFEQRRDTIKQFIADFSDAVGAGDATYNKTFGRQPPKSTKTPTAGDYQAMYALNRALMEMNRLAVSQQTNRFQLTASQFVAGLAQKSGITFQQPQSKFMVPFPYGSTLEQLAERYLGDRDRWIEIATLNDLRSPYVDEEGFDLTLLTSGSGNQVIVADASNLYIGQGVWLSSTATVRTMRHITAIRVLSSTQAILTLDGDPTLSAYTTTAQATLHAFLPGTVNSMQTIYIPSADLSGIPDYQTKPIPGLSVTDQLFAVGGVDLLLTQDNDLVITQDGDGRLAVGLTAIIQDARIKLSCPQGSLPRHKGFGLGIQIGSSIVDLDINAFSQAVQQAFIDDPTYTSVTSSFITVNGPSVQVGIQVGITGVQQTIPLTFMLPQSS